MRVRKPARENVVIIANVSRQTIEMSKTRTANLLEELRSAIHNGRMMFSINARSLGLAVSPAE
jgi:hypothetical protein